MIISLRLKLQLSTILFGIDGRSEEKDNLHVLDASRKLYLSSQESLHVNMTYIKKLSSQANISEGQQGGRREVKD